MDMDERFNDVAVWIGVEPLMSANAFGGTPMPSPPISANERQ
jgi:hypothetical protein